MCTAPGSRPGGPGFAYGLRSLLDLCSPHKYLQVVIKAPRKLPLIPNRDCTLPLSLYEMFSNLLIIPLSESSTVPEPAWFWGHGWNNEEDQVLHFRKRFTCNSFLLPGTCERLHVQHGHTEQAGRLRTPPPAPHTRPSARKHLTPATTNPNLAKRAPGRTRLTRL